MICNEMVLDFISYKFLIELCMLKIDDYYISCFLKSISEMLCKNMMKNTFLNDFFKPNRPIKVSLKCQVFCKHLFIAF